MSIENLKKANEMLGLVHQNKKKTKILRDWFSDTYSSKDMAEQQTGLNSAESHINSSIPASSLSDQPFESEVVEDSDTNSSSHEEEVAVSVCSDSCSEKYVPESHSSGERRVYEQQSISAVTLKSKEAADRLVKRGESMDRLELLAAKVKLHAKFCSVKSTEQGTVNCAPIPASDLVCQGQDIRRLPTEVEELPGPGAAYKDPAVKPCFKVEELMPFDVYQDMNGNKPSQPQDKGLINEFGNGVIIQKRNSGSDSERQADLRSKICIDKLDQNCRRLLQEKKVLQEEIKQVKKTADELGKQVDEQSQELSRLREILGRKM
uniref:Uncharacterized protein n=1 Tax=Ditylenchus dipsaci TaxID=166011 RepID=A0A915EFY2_9BILA